MLPDPNDVYPVRLADGTPVEGTVQLAALDLPENLTIGRYTYASTFTKLAEPNEILQSLLPYHFSFSQERVNIGPFCQLADGARIVTASANHATRGVSTFPFPIFDVDARATYKPDVRDTFIGADVWIGTRALILPGAHIGHGTIIGAGTVVGGNVPPYSIVTGNRDAPRQRFADGIAEALVAQAWWMWPDSRISENWDTIANGTPEALLALAP